MILGGGVERAPGMKGLEENLSFSGRRVKKRGYREIPGFASFAKRGSCVP